MKRCDLEQYLHEHIPLSRAMGVEVIKPDWNGVTLRAPLAPNINHRETVFGGSASAVAILAAWALFICPKARLPLLPLSYPNSTWLFSTTPNTMRLIPRTVRLIV